MLRRFRSFPLLLVMALAGVSARAEEWTPAPTGSVLLEGGVVGRNGTYVGAETTTSLAGFSPTVLRLRGDLYPVRWFGVEADLLADVFQAKQGELRLRGPSARFHARAAAAVRYVSPGGFYLGGSLGYGVTSIPYIRVVSGLAPSPESVLSHGPLVRVSVGYLGERFQIVGGVVGGLPIFEGVTTLEPQLWVGGRFIDLGPAALWVGLSTSYLAEGNVGTRTTAGDLRLALGLKLEWLQPRPAQKPVDGASGGATSLALTLTLPDGAPAVGALVSFDGAAPRTADAQGQVTEVVTPGSHAVKATLAGYRVVETRTTAVDQQTTRVPVRFEPLTGPGSLAGVVRASASGKPVAEVTVTAGELPPVVTGADGKYRFEKLGPGPVQVRFEAQGFTTAEEVAQVPPEAAASLDVQLEALGKGSPATVRGLVRSRTGEALKASVIIKGSAVKVQVSPEGRFFVSVPGGTYLFIISAPGYVTQSKKVVLADGDQAILHTDLQKVAR
jgi:hypothetical protein